MTLPVARRSLTLLAVLVAGTVLASAAAADAGHVAGSDARIRLAAGAFDPSRVDGPDLPPGLAISGYAPGASGYYIVQFDGPVTDTAKAAANKAGAELLDYLPDNAFKVRMTPVEAEAVEALDVVTWVGLFHPAYKLSPALETSQSPFVRIRIERGAPVSPTVAAIEAAGATPLRQDGTTVIAAVAPSRLEAIARVLDVAWVEPYSFAAVHNEQAGGVIMNGSAAIGRGYDGSTQVVAVLDTGIGDGTPTGAHPDIPTGRVVQIRDWSSADLAPCLDVIPDGPRDVDSGHGTHTAVSAVGGGGTGGVGTGVAPAAGLVFQAVEDWADFSSHPLLCPSVPPDGYYLVGIPADLTSIYQQAYDDGARVHSNSWGTSDTAGDYTADSASSDAFMFANPGFLITFSAGNDGVDEDADGVVDTGSLGSPGTAKNVLTVGASEGSRSDSWPCDTGLGYTSTDAYQSGTCSDMAGFNTLGTAGARWGFTAEPLFSDVTAGNPEQMAPFSSRGPVDDGRIKPDIVAPGTWILSGYSGEYQQGYGGTTNPQNGLYQWDGWGMPYDADYKYMGGTSMSNPLAAGAAAVVFDFYAKADSHIASAALVKATLINSARDLLDENNDGVDDNDFPIPNIHEGWGMIDLDEATDGSHVWVDQTVGLATAETLVSAYEVDTAGSPFKVTLVWSDAESSVAAATNLVNDLDLEVVAPNGTTTYWGNDFSGGWSQSGGSAEAVNNVENVFVSSASVGAWTVKVHASNVPVGPQPFALVVDGQLAPPPVDATPPVISGTPSDQTAEATGPSGAIVTYTEPTATDDVDGSVPVSCVPGSGSTFPLGTTTVVCSAADSSGNIATDEFDVTVVDTTAPELTVPSGVTEEATGPSGAMVSWTTSASDLVDGDLSGSVSCTPTSGSTFALGTTGVSCSVTDSSGNTANAGFDATVEDTTPPVVSNVPSNITEEATDPSGAVVTYDDSAVTATDLVDGDLSGSVSCLPVSGSTFPLGSTPVSCSVTDSSGNTGSDGFDVTVQDTTPPVLSGVPTGITEEATGPSGAVVSWTAPTASDLVDGDLSGSVSCTPTSGSTFALGATSVSCSVTDSSGNTANAGFDVTVEDTTSPDLSVPSSVTEEATGASGAVVSWTTSASDLVDGDLSESVSCSPVSGSTFALGTTPVSCSVSDSSGNAANAGFDVTVQDTTAPDLAVPDDITVDATSPSGAVVGWPPPTASDLVDGDLSGSVSCTPTSGSTFALGTTPVSCLVTDSSGNTASAGFDVTVEDPSVDSTPPVLSGVPTGIAVEAAGPTGAIVEWDEPSATDDVDGSVSVTCLPSSGSMFPIGATPVSCSAQDGSGNEASAGFDVTVTDPTGVFRYAGPTRYSTAAAISAADFPDPDLVDTVFIAFGGNFPDALAGAAVAGRIGAPLLLVTQDSIPAEAATELERLGPDTIVVLGGEAVVAPSIESALGAYAASVERLAGSNRYSTAVAISQFGFQDPSAVDTVMVATGQGFADALAGGPAAAQLGAPVLLTESDTLPDAVANEIARLGPSRIVVVGGSAVVSEAVVARLQALAPDVDRIAGADRYETAVAISFEVFDSSTRAYLSTGLDFPDALSGAAAAGWWSGPVLLVPGGSIPAAVQAEIERLGSTTGIILGGTDVVSTTVESAFSAIL